MTNFYLCVLTLITMLFTSFSMSDQESARNSKHLTEEEQIEIYEQVMDGIYSTPDSSLDQNEYDLE